MNLDEAYGTRPTVDEYFLAMAILVSKRSTCLRRRVGSVLTDSSNHVLATGYNGTASGQRHCLDFPCPGANAKSGEKLDECYAIHAEQNALLQCRDVRTIYTCYTTTAMCVTCTKLLLNTTCKRIVFLESYPQSIISQSLWEKSGGEWKHMNEYQLHEVDNVLNRTIISPK